jgi:hypothetical protein
LATIRRPFPFISLTLNLPYPRSAAAFSLLIIPNLEIIGTPVLLLGFSFPLDGPQALQREEKALPIAVRELALLFPNTPCLSSHTCHYKSDIVGLSSMMCQYRLGSHHSRRTSAGIATLIPALETSSLNHTSCRLIHCAILISLTALPRSSTQVGDDLFLVDSFPGLTPDGYRGLIDTGQSRLKLLTYKTIQRPVLYLYCIHRRRSKIKYNCTSNPSMVAYCIPL